MTPLLLVAANNGLQKIILSCRSNLLRPENGTPCFTRLEDKLDLNIYKQCPHLLAVWSWAWSKLCWLTAAAVWETKLFAQLCAFHFKLPSTVCPKDLQLSRELLITFIMVEQQ